MQYMTSILAAFMALSVAVQGSPVPMEARDIFSPPILYPNAATVWFSGQRHNVTWDASNPPKSISNGALIQLKTAGTSVFPPISLASNFSLLDGRHEIQLPSTLTSRDDYEIVLFGDSGNTSPAFTILA